MQLFFVFLLISCSLKVKSPSLCLILEYRDLSLSVTRVDFCAIVLIMLIFFRKSIVCHI